MCLLLEDLVRVAIQVCSGMIHLTGLGYVHRDIASRNVMLTANLTAKLGDFGLCRLLDNSKYTNKDGKLPIKHMPLESSRYGEFSEKSDVWSFGILLYEMFTGGERPFHDIEADDLLALLDKDGKPEFPDLAPPEM